MTLTEILIHTLEAFIVGLVLVKLVQVRSLYLRSRPTKDRLTVPVKTNVHSHFAYEKTTQHSDRDHLCLKDLPLPEVTFSNEHKATIRTTAEEHQNLEQKCVLENYIDDFFSEQTKKTDLYTNSNNEKEEDEFITIQKENAEIVRKIQVNTSVHTRLAS